MSNKQRLVIVGGVAGGASAAARARRLSEEAEIIVLERGPYVSFANCGLPYHLGGVIEDRDDLLLQTPESLHQRFNLDVRVNHEVLSINREKKSVQVKDLRAGKELEISYDTLILSPGAEPFRPPIPGIEFPNVFTMRTLPDLDRLMTFIDQHPVKHATVIGAGFIGLEVAENLRHRKLAVTLVEKEKQVMPPMDAEMTTLLNKHLRLHEVDLRLGQQVSAIVQESGKTIVQFSAGKALETDLIILSIGVRAETKLAKEAGLKIGERGGIAVDEWMHTSDPAIFAVGDAVETRDMVTGVLSLVPLAGPANRQGRMAATNALTQQPVSYRGTQGTWICKVFDLAAAQTGASEKLLKRLGKSFQKVYVHPGSHAGYYPGASPLAMKVLFDPADGRILGAQAVGADGVDKRIDVLATAIAGKMTIHDLCHLELAYAPPFGSAKDPVNLVGMVAENLLLGLHRGVHVDQLSEVKTESQFSPILLDVRTLAEHEAGSIPGSSHIPVDELRSRHTEIPRNREIIIYCQVGLRGYVAQRLLSQYGFNCRNLVGGYKTWTLYQEEKPFMNSTPAQGATSGNDPKQTPGSDTPAADSQNPKRITKSSVEGTIEEVPLVELDACGLQCPGPLLKMKSRLEEMSEGQCLKVTASDPGFPMDAVAWCHRSGHKLVKSVQENGRYVAIIEKSTAPAIAALSGEASGASSPTTLGNGKKQKMTMVVFSNDLDRAYATFIIANGAAAMGMDVTLFFTFWGLNILRRGESPAVQKSVVESMFGMMMPKGVDALSLSKMHFGGLGTAMMKNVMSEKKVAPLSELLDSARKAGVRLVACTMSMDIMGIKKAEIIDGVEEGGVATYIDSAEDSRINLFV